MGEEYKRRGKAGHTSRAAKRKSHRGSSAKRLVVAFEMLEDRTLLSTAVIVVNTILDATDPTGSQVVSLRDAVNTANANSTSSTTITFSPSVFSSVQIISLASQLTLSNTKEPTIIQGPAGGVTISGNNSTRVFQVTSGVTAVFSNVTIANGKISGASTSPYWGGGILNSGNLTLTNVNILNNFASYVGGGIYNSETSGAKITLTNVTIAGNQSASDGGGIFNDQTAVLTDVTISGNSAQDGGGLDSNFHGEIVTTLNDVTIANNSAVNNGGGVWNDGSAAQLTLANSIVANNTVTGSVSVGPDVRSAITSSGYNLIGETDGSSGWQSSDHTGSIASSLNPELGSLANNGGLTETMLPQAGSPAIDAGSDALIPASITTDQRGSPRIANGVVDIGAVEVQPSTPQAPTITSAPNAIFSTSVTNSFTVVVPGYPVPSIQEGGTLPSGVSFTDEGNGTAILSGTPTLGSVGTYTLTLSAVNGVSPAAAQTFSLIVSNANTWISAAGGDWDNPNNWSLGHVPTATENALIDLPATDIITHSQNDADSVNSITSTASLVLSSGSLNVASTIQASSLTLSGGTLENATLQLGTSGTNFTATSGTLSGVTVDGNFQVIGNNQLTITNGLTLNGNLSLGNATSVGWLYFNGNQTLGGSGTVLFGGYTGRANTGAYLFNGLYAGTNSSTLTISSGILVEGQLGFLIYDNGYNSLGYSGGTLINQGTIETNITGGSITIAGINDQNFGNLNAAVSGSQLNLSGSWLNPGNIEAQNNGAINLNSGISVTGGSVSASAGGTVTFTNATFNGLTLNGSFIAPAGSVLTINSGLTLNGNLTINGSVIEAIGTQTFEGNGTIQLVSPSGQTPQLAIEGTATLTLATGITVDSGTGSIGNQNQTSGTNTLINEGTVNTDVAGQTLTIKTSSFTNTGVLKATNGGNLTISHAISLDGNGLFTTSTSSVVQIGGNILGNTTAIGISNLQSTTILNGAGTSASPQFLEVMAQDLGNVLAGFSNNFVYQELELAGSDYVELVDQSQNSSSNVSDAIYAQSVVVPTGTALNLNGLHLYARDIQISGSVINGTIQQLPNAGAIALATPTPGHISTAGELDAWTFFGYGGHYVSVVVNPGSTVNPAPISPQLQWVSVQLLDSNNNVLATAVDSSAGALVTLNSVLLSVDGAYTIAIRAANGHTSNTGNYMVSAYDVTPLVQPLVLNQEVSGSVATPFAVDEWNFSAPAGEQIQFNLNSASAAGLAYSLVGPNGYSVFTNLTASSQPINLGASGNYTLTASGPNSATGNYSFEISQTTVTSLIPGTTYNGTWVGTGQVQLFSIPVTNTGAMSINLSDPSTLDNVRLYASFGTAPTEQTYLYAATGSGSSQSLFIPTATPGTWYVLAYASTIARAPSQYTLEATIKEITLTGTTPHEGTSNAATTLTLTGGVFNSGTTVALLSSTGASYPATSVTVNLPTQISATFAPGTVPAGTYSIVADQNDGSSTELPNVFTMVSAGQAVLTTHLEVPNPMTRHIAQTLYIDYANTGSVPMAAPLLVLSATNPLGQQGALFTLDPALVGTGLWTSATPVGFSQSIEILGNGATPGILQPGESERIPVYYAGWLDSQWDFTDPTLNFSLQVIQANDTTSVNWPSLQSSLKPTGINNTAWNSIYSGIVSQLGTTAGGYVQLLDSEAQYLSNIGEDVTDVQSLWGFAIQQADNSLNPLAPYLASVIDDSLPTPGSLSLSFDRVFAEPITGRDTMSTLGMGWTTSWQTYASIAYDGTVTIIGPGGSQRIFQPDSRTPGTYFSQPGDTGTLSADGHGGYLLTEADGTETDFTASGLLNYMQDTDDNRITAGYIGNRLTSLTASSGQYIDISYNAAGLIVAISDSAGRTITYGYDSTNTYLTSVTSFDGQTTYYSYNTVAGSPSQNALTSITFPGNTHQYFTYNSQGMLASTYSDNGAEPQNFTYSMGEVSTTDGTGATSSIYYNENGQVAKSIDALGNPTYYTYDGNFNLASVTNALGESETYTYNNAGEAITSTDFLGHTTYFSYTGSFNQLTSMTDANGNVTQYSYSASGDLLGTTYANGTSSSSTYDPEGNALSFVNANGQPITYTYNSAGQVLTESFSDGSSYVYSYDNQGNLLTATDATGTTTFTYNSADEMAEVAYPNGMYIKFQYNTAGQRAQMVDQTGFTTNYIYDSVGRLSELTDANGNMIVTYSYDADGRLSQKVNGNGTYTTYTYDANGNVLSLINYAPGGTINSSFTYTYNSVGLETSETTIDGTWLYSYDADGELTQAIFTPNSSDPDGLTSQDLQYFYDAMGNRTSTIINGATTTYTINDMNEYTSVGGVSYLYDADGNLISDGTDTYTYSSQNQLIGAIGPSGVTSYIYNALGQRAISKINGHITQYLIDPAGLGEIVDESDDNSGRTTHYIFGLGLVNETTGTGVYFYDYDTASNTLDLTNESGAKVDIYNYLPFGVTISAHQAVVNPFQFSGQLEVETDDSGLDFMRARYMAPSLGRFTAIDPIGAQDPNLYAYGSNNPISQVDPSGRLNWGIILRELYLALVLISPALPQAPITTTDILDPPNSVELAKDALETAFDPEAEEAQQEADELANVIENPNPSFVGETDGEIAADVGGIEDGAFAEAIGANALGGLAALGDIAVAAIAGWNLGTFIDHTFPDNLISQGFYQLGLFLFSHGAGSSFGSTTVSTVNVQDPNAMYGPAGYGSQNFIADNGSFAYQVDFENDPTATAPAQEVTIADQLSPDLNWSTFALTGIGWGNFYLTIPINSEYFQTTVPMTYDGFTFAVEVEAGIESGTGLVYATFQAIDPDTSLPPSNPLIGFLPPENGTGIGEGYLSYSVSPESNLTTGTQISNVADVTFDNGLTIATNLVDDDDPSEGTDPTKDATVTIDSGSPTSAVTALPPTQNSSSFSIQWSGQDDTGGSGIASYTIYVSTNGGAFVPIPSLTNTTLTNSIFTGVVGDSYGFYSVATDNVGNIQATPTGPQASTYVLYQPTLTGLSGVTSITYGTSSISFSGQVSSSTVYPESGEMVAVTLNGVTVNAPINSQGDFAAVFNTSNLPVAATEYAVSYSYAGDASFLSVSDDSTTSLIVIRATPVVTANAPNVRYTGNAYVTSSATVSGVSGSTITDEPIIFTYYNQSSPTTPISVPTYAGTYEVTATYPGDNNYAQATSEPVTFTICKATAPVTLSNLSQTYTGSPLSVIETTNPTGLAVAVTYNNSPIAPTNAGSYTVIATINNPNYFGCVSGTLIINQATPDVTITAPNASYTGSAYTDTSATVTGIGGVPITDFAPTFTYFNQNAPTVPISDPTNPGTYEVMATFPGDVNYSSAQSELATFTINATLQNVTSQLKVSKTTSTSLQAGSLVATQTITITNTGSTALAGPLYLVLSSLTGGTFSSASLSGGGTLSAGTTSASDSLASAGSLYLDLSSGGLPAGANITLTIKFKVTNSATFNDSVLFLAGQGTP